MTGPRAGTGRTPWWLTLSALLVAVIAYGFQQTAITPALPVVQHDLHASREWTTWLFSGYFIVASVSPVFLGKLADRSGKRRVFIGALVVFLAGSIGTALSPSIAIVVLCRLVQGIGGIVFPLSFSIARDELPPGRVAGGIGLLTAGFGVGSVTGYTLGGLITQFLGWRWIFWLGAATLFFAAVLARLTVPRSPTRTPHRLDVPGAVLFGGAAAALIIAITEGPQRGWTAPAPVAGFVAAVALAVGWYHHERRTAEPLIDLRVLSSRPIFLTNAASMFVGYAVLGVSVLLPFLIESAGPSSSFASLGLGTGPLLVGVVLLPRAVGQAVGGATSAGLARRLGRRVSFTGGMLLTTAGAVGLSLDRDQLWLLMIELAALGVGFGLAIGVSGSIVTLAADPSQTGIATSINSVLRRIGGGVGAQAAVAFLAAMTLAGSTRPAPAAYTAAFGVCAAVALAGALCAAFIPNEGLLTDSGACRGNALPADRRMTA